MRNLAGRHPAIQDVCVWFHYEHLPEHLYETSKRFHDLAEELLDTIPDDAQLTHSLNHLLIAKDCAVRAMRKSLDGGPTYTPLHP